MSDNDDDNHNKTAIGKVVKKSVSDVFGEEEQPPAQPSYTTQRYGYGGGWENPGFAFQRTSGTAKKNYSTAAWGSPKPRATAMRTEFNDVGDPTSVHYTVAGWKELRDRIFRSILKEFDWERIVLSVDDQTLLEQTMDTIMRRSKFQAGREGNAYNYGSLVQVPISVGDSPPPDPQALPASSVDLDEHDGWGEPGEDENVIDVTPTAPTLKTGEDHDPE